MLTLPTDAELDATIKAAFGVSRLARPVATTLIMPTVRAHSTERVVTVTRPCVWCTKKGSPCSMHGGPKRQRGVTMTTEERGRRSAASRIGVPFEEYEQHHRNFERWCTEHRAWHPLKSFGSDQSRPSGVPTYCRAAKNALQRRTRKPQRTRVPYVPVTAQACAVCRKMRAQDGKNCHRHGGPSRGTAWQQRKRRLPRLPK